MTCFFSLYTIAALAFSLISLTSAAVIPHAPTTTSDTIINTSPIQPANISLVQVLDSLGSIESEYDTEMSIAAAISAMGIHSKDKKPHAADFFESLTIPAAAGGTSDDKDQEYNSDFLAPKFIIPHEKGPERWSCQYNKNEITSTKYGTIISIGKRSTTKPFSCGELISRQPNIGYGTYSVDMISTNIPGHVTALFVIANGISELDIELTGRDPTVVWINIWEGSKQHPIKVPLGFDASKDWHNYAIEWHKDFVAWYVDGKLIHKRSDVSTADPTTTQYKLALNSWTHDNEDQWAGKFRYPSDGHVPKSYFRNLSYKSG